jgi:hypothetical protein
MRVSILHLPDRPAARASSSLRRPRSATKSMDGQSNFCVTFWSVRPSRVIVSRGTARTALAHGFWRGVSSIRIIIDIKRNSKTVNAPCGGAARWNSMPMVSTSLRTTPCLKCCHYRERSQWGRLEHLTCTMYIVGIPTCKKYNGNLCTSWPTVDPLNFVGEKPDEVRLWFPDSYYT